MIPRLWHALLAAAPARFWAMVGAAMALTVFAAALVWIVWHGGWPISQAPRQLDILGKALWFILLGIIIIVIALTARRVDASGVLGHLSVSGEDDPQPAAKVTTTTTVETPPKKD